jgi:hypothetical protein
MAESLNFADRWELVRLTGGMGGLVDRKQRGSRLLIQLVWIISIRRPMSTHKNTRGCTIASVRNTPSMEILSFVRWGDLPLWRITSFMAWVVGSSEVVKSCILRSPFKRV